MSHVLNSTPYSTLATVPVATVSVSSLSPIAGETLTLTCAITAEDVPITWMDPNGNILSTGPGITVGPTVFAGGMSISMLVIDNVLESQGGQYICASSAGNEPSGRIEVLSE